MPQGHGGRPMPPSDPDGAFSPMIIAMGELVTEGETADQLKRANAGERRT